MSWVKFKVSAGLEALGEGLSPFAFPSFWGPPAFLTPGSLLHITLTSAPVVTSPSLTLILLFPPLI